MKHKLNLLYSWLVKTITFFLPDQPLMMRFRGWLYSLGMQSCGGDFQVSSTVTIKNLENLSVGNNVYLAPNVIINAIDNIYLDSEVMIGFNSVLVSANHTLRDGSYRYGESSLAPIYIGRGTWVSANCTIVAGATVGAGCLIGANSMVKGDCTLTGLYAGSPARCLRKVI